MLAAIYFPVIAGLAGARAAPEELRSIVSADLQGALTRMARRMHVSGMVPTQDAQAWQLYADLLLTCGKSEEAESAYQFVQRCVRGSRVGVRILSCRNAAWQAIFRHRFGLALMSFSRVIEDEEASCVARLEARVGASLALYCAGQVDEAVGLCDALSQALRTMQIEDHALWSELVAMIAEDMRIQRRVRTLLGLHEHLHTSAAKYALPEASSVADHARVLNAVSCEFLKHRANYLVALQRLACGERDGLAGLHKHLEWTVRMGLASYPRLVRTECAMAALATHLEGVAEQFIAPLETLVCGRASAPRSGGERDQIELLYCFAKIRQLQDKSKEALRYYTAYASLAIEILRSDNRAVFAFLGRIERGGILPVDDVSLRLPPKYRRAYRYMVENLHRARLSVGEVAAEAGVTERALQAAFKAHLGLSPGELLRRVREEQRREIEYI